MEELARLMEELTVALKQRADAGAKAEALAREVQALPKLSVLLADDSEAEGSSEPDALLYKLQLKLELQNLVHAKQELLDTFDMASSTLGQVRNSVDAIASSAKYRDEDLLEGYAEKIRYERSMYAAIMQQKQDLLFAMARKVSLIAKLAGEKTPERKTK